MKKIYLAILLLFSLTAGAQNLLPNGNFEQFSFCPNNVNQITNANGWNIWSGVPDYFNACNAAGAHLAGVPSNAYGYQAAQSGNGYAGIFTYINSQNYKEYLIRNLPALTVGIRYQVSMSVCLADSSGYTTSDLGVLFYKNGVPTTAGGGATNVNVAPQVSFTSFGNIRDTEHWVRVVKTFVADSAYTTIMIGGFGSTTNTHPLATGFPSNSLYNAAYYYIDSVVVVPDIDVFVSPIKDSIYCVGDSIYIDYTVESNRYTPLNNFTLEMSDATGSFASPVILGVYHFDTSGVIHGRIPPATPVGTGYLLRIRSSDHADLSLPSTPISITNDPVNKPVGHSNAPVCTGNTIYLDAFSSTVGVKYAWSGPRGFHDTTQNTTVKLATVLDSGAYIITAYIAGCTAFDTVVADVIHVIGTADITSDTIACQNDTLALKSHIVGKAISYKWVGSNGYIATNKDSLILHPPLTASGQYIFTAFFAGCSFSDTIDIRVKPSPQNVIASGNNSAPLCAGNALNLDGSATGTGHTQQWDGPNGFSSVLEHVVIDSVQPANSGNYVFTANIDGCKVTDTVTVVVKPLPPMPDATSNSPLLTGDALILTNNKPVNGISYSWTGPNGFASTKNDPTIDDFGSANIGIYVLSATLNGCTLSDSVSVILNKNTDPIIIYPNPSNGNFSIHAVLSKDQQVPVSITNSSGQVVYEETAQTQNKILKLNISLKDDLSGGVYTLRIRADDKTTASRLVVNRTK